MNTRKNKHIHFASFIIISFISLGISGSYQKQENHKNSKNGGCLIDHHKKNNQDPERNTLEKLEKIVTKSIIEITRGGHLQGSGVIICQTNTALFMLTSIHVIGIKPSPKIDFGDGQSKPGDPYIITTYEKQTFEIGHKNYKQNVYEFPGNTDLVVLKVDFPNSSNYSHKVARLTNWIQEDMDTYILGYLPCTNLLKENNKPIQFSQGKLEKKLSKPEISEPGLTGYDIKYSNNTIRGMSGSPIFDANGRVLGIHAATKKEKDIFDAENCQKMPENSRNEFGNNWGISIKKFAQIQSSHLRTVLPTLSNNLVIDSSPLENISQESRKPSPSNSPLCPPFIEVGETDCLE
ncbi:MAG: serine protease [Cyanobacteria bacterium P01_F01_bin.143]